MPARKAKNPRLKGHPVDQYIEAHWGNSPKKLTEVDCPALRTPQQLVKMGNLEKLYVQDGEEIRIIKSLKPAPALAFGAKDNKLYIVAGSTAEMAALQKFGKIGEKYPILRVDYTAKKGDETVYWYHDHEPPYPELFILPRGFPQIRGGQYTVAKEGIVG